MGTWKGNNDSSKCHKFATMFESNNSKIKLNNTEKKHANIKN